MSSRELTTIRAALDAQARTLRGFNLEEESEKLRTWPAVVGGLLCIALLVGAGVALALDYFGVLFQ